MNCDDVETSEIAEKYIRGEMSSEQQDLYEQHFLTCARCFAQLQTLQAIQSELKATATALGAITARSGPRWGVWIAAAAAIILTTALTLRVMHPKPPSSVASQPTAAHAKAPNLDLLASVEPPPYKAPVLRGPSAGNREFRAAMTEYQQGHYQQAIPGLEAASKAEPASADPKFFLGVCYLMQGRTDDAIRSFDQTIAVPDSLDAEMAHFFKAKALLRKQDSAAAKRELEAVVAMRGDYEKQSAALLQQLAAASR